MEGIHLIWFYTLLKHLDTKVLLSIGSDVYAMNAISKTNLGFYNLNRFSVEAVEEIYEGIKLACRQYNVDR